MKKEEQPKKRLSWYWRILIITGAVIVAGIPLAYVPGLGNRYAEKVYPKLYSVEARITDKVPFALGELLMYVSAVIVAATVVISVVFGIAAIVRAVRRKKTTGAESGAEEEPRKMRGAGFYRMYMKVFLVLTVIGLWLYVFQWWLPYHDYVLGEKKHLRDFTVEDLEKARNAIVERINEAIKKVPRDAEGKIIYPTEEQEQRVIAESMRKLAGTYPRLAGFYAKPKAAWCSDVLDWMGIGGYTYPYTMELTYNKYVDPLYRYSLLTHETAHNKGYYKENEANFLSFLAAYLSDDPLMCYSGCVDGFLEVDEDYYAALRSLYGEEKAKEIYLAQPQIDETIVSDQADAREVADQAYAADDHPLEQYSDTAADIAEEGWDTQEQLIRDVGYHDVVYLIAEYFAER